MYDYAEIQTCVKIEMSENVGRPTGSTKKTRKNLGLKVR